MSGGLFTLSTHIQPKGELLAFGLFGGISLLGWVWSLAIHGEELESEDYLGDDDDEHEEEEGDGEDVEEVDTDEEAGPYDVAPEDVTRRDFP